MGDLKSLAAGSDHHHHTLAGRGPVDTPITSTHRGNQHVSKKLLAVIVAGVTAASLSLATAAYALTTFRSGGATVKQFVATSTDAWMAPGPNTWQTVPATGITVTVPSGQKRLLTASFSAESQCQGGGWCSVRIVYVNSSATVELAPASGNDYAFDSDGDTWDQHTVQRSSPGWLSAGSYRVYVQAQRVSATSFRLDDYHLTVGLVAP